MSQTLYSEDLLRIPGDSFPQGKHTGPRGAMSQFVDGADRAVRAEREEAGRTGTEWEPLSPQFPS